MMSYDAGSYCLPSDGRLRQSAVCGSKTWRGGFWFRIPDIKDNLKRSVYFNIQNISKQNPVRFDHKV